MSGPAFLRSLLVSEFPQTNKNGGDVIILQDTATLKEAMDVRIPAWLS